MRQLKRIRPISKEDKRFAVILIVLLFLYAALNLVLLIGTIYNAIQAP